MCSTHSERLKAIERQVRALTARLEITQILEKYLWLQDIGAWDEWESLLTMDVTLDVDDGRSPLRVQGRDELRAFMSRALKDVSFVRHFLHVPAVLLEGDDRASARATFAVVSTNRRGEDVFGAGFYQDELVRRKDGWLISSVTARVDFLGPRARGWSRQRGIPPG